MAQRLALVSCALCAILLFASPITSSGQLSSVEADQPGPGTPLEVSRTSPEHTSISLHSPDVTVTTRTVGYENFQVFEMAGEPLVPEEGCPAVPQITRFYRIPNTGGVDLIVTEEEYDLIEGVNPLPVQEEMGSFGQLVRDPGVYSRDAWYPAEVAEVSAPAVMRDFRVVTVTLHPVQVNPVTHQARIYRHLSASLIANGRPGENELLNPGRPSGAWAEIYSSQIANLDDRALEEMTTTPGTYLILSKNTTGARQWADSLFIWKTRKGFKVVVDARPSWTTGTMTTAIRTLYASAAATDTPLEYVCLIGDPQYADGLPTDGMAYDHNFARATDTDEVEDIAVGRLSGATLEQMAIINKKIMIYEREPTMEDTLWYHKAFFDAGVSMSVASNYSLMQWAAQMFRLYTGVTNNTVLYHTTTAVNEAAIIAQINGGLAFFLWRGGWIGGMSTSLPGQTNPNNRFPVTVTIECSTGDFGSGFCISESWLVAGTLAQPRGGICGIGEATAGGHAPQNYTLTGGLVFNICNLNVEHIGTCLAGAKLRLHLTYGLNSTYAVNFSRWCNLMGDPGLSMWTDVPEVMTVSHPAILNVGARQVAVQVTREADNVPVEDALVVLWKRGTDSTWVRGLTDSQGLITLPVRVTEAGEMMLTVTKRNHKPYLFSIPCSPAEQMCTVSSYALDDDNTGGSSGNGDGVMNPGEIMDISAYVKNVGVSASATQVLAHLTSPSSRILMLQADAAYPDLAPGDSALGSVPFRVQIAPDMQNRESALLMFTINTALGQTQGALELRCVSGAIEYRGQQLVEGVFDPGTTRTLHVTLRNSGNLPMSGVTARLLSYSPFVQVEDGNAIYGDMPLATDVTNTADGFTVSSNVLAFRGHQASMLIITTTSGGHLDSAVFVLPVGTATASDPAGPDSYGYFAYDNSDVDYAMHPIYEYVDISQTGVGTNLNLTDTGEQTQVTQVWSTARPLPFPFKFYGQVYDTVTVCANGWMAFGNQAWNPAFRNYPIPAMVAPEAMIAPYWDDLKTSAAGQGVWMYHQADSHRVIFQWKAGAGGSYGTSLDFEVILFDTAFYPTFDGNGLILVQYDTVTMNLPSGDGSPSDAPGCSIGIQAPRGVVGLGYVYQNSYAPGAASVVSGRAILFTTSPGGPTGNIAGTVTDAQTGLPIADVTVSADSCSACCDSSDANGFYRIENVLCGTYSVRASKHRFNIATVENVVVELDSTVIVDFALLHPEMALSTDTLRVELGAQTMDTTFSIMNEGNGPLDCRVQLRPGGTDTIQPWGVLSTIDVTGATGNRSIQGCEFVGDRWWISAHGGLTQPDRLYRFDNRGNLVDSIPHPSGISNRWYDLASDGQWVYGADGEYILGVDSTGAGRISFPSPVSPARALAYDPLTDHFWAADYTSSIFELSREGEVVQEIARSPFDSMLVTGFAWHSTDPDGCKLYLFGRHWDVTGALVAKMNPETHAVQQLGELSVRPGDYAGGCAITAEWDGTWLVFGGILRNTQGDQLSVRQIAVNDTWISVTPAELTVAAQGSENVTVSMNPATLRPFTYFVNADVRSAIQDTMMTVALVIQVLDLPADDPGSSDMPEKFALHQNYPNPFNPITEIQFDLPQAAHVQLKVFNTLGQLVVTLVDETCGAGAYRVAWDGNNVASGLYIYQLTAGGFTDVKKMVLIR